MFICIHIFNPKIQAYEEAIFDKVGKIGFKKELLFFKGIILSSTTSASEIWPSTTPILKMSCLPTEMLETYSKNKLI